MKRNNFPCSVLTVQKKTFHIFMKPSDQRLVMDHNDDLFCEDVDRSTVAAASRLILTPFDLHLVSAQELRNLRHPLEGH